MTIQEEIKIYEKRMETRAIATSAIRICPVCGKIIDVYGDYKGCPNCLRAIDWGEEK